MLVDDSIDRLSVNDDALFYNEIRNKLINELIAILNWIPGLLGVPNSLIPQFDTKSVFVRPLSQPWPDRVVNAHRTAHDPVHQIFFK